MVHPAEYSEDNVPYEPKHFLPISIQGYDEDEFHYGNGVSWKYRSLFDFSRSEKYNEYYQ